jgi:hypothetical protein
MSCIHPTKTYEVQELDFANVNLFILLKQRYLGSGTWLMNHSRRMNYFMCFQRRKELDRIGAHY